MRTFNPSPLAMHIVILMLFGQSSFAQNVNVPNPNFKAYLLGNSAINSNGDTAISYTEAAAYTGTIDLFDGQLGDLTGISAFSGITYLNCSYNNLTQLDISGCTALTHLDCGYNGITHLDVSNNINLTILICGVNQLSNLDVTQNTALTYFGCYNNQLTSLNVSNNSFLYRLDCNDNLISGTLNLSNLIALQHLECQTNQITNLILGGDTALVYLNCSSNSISFLDISTNIALANIGCSSNLLTSLDVSYNVALNTLDFSANDISNINISNNLMLNMLACNLNSSLSHIDFSNNALLESVYAISNQFTQLDFSNNPELQFLWCYNNNLNRLNLRNGNNSLISDFDFNALNNPNLICIEVDDTTYSSQNWTQIDSTAHFSVDCTVGLVEKAKDQDVLLYPNPTNGKITLSNLSGNTEVLVFNQMGRLIIEEKTNEQFFMLNLGGLDDGLYIISIKGGRTIEHYKVIKTN